MNTTTYHPDPEINAGIAADVLEAERINLAIGYPPSAWTCPCGASHSRGHRCDVAVPPKLLMCKRHWYMVPKDLRDAVWLTYRPGQEIDKSPTMEYLETAHEAINAVAVKEGHEPPFRVAAL